MDGWMDGWIWKTAEHGDHSFNPSFVRLFGGIFWIILILILLIVVVVVAVVVEVLLVVDIDVDVVIIIIIYDLYSTHGRMYACMYECMYV